jgi:UDPglucose 6-dehydrogenase
MSLEVAIVGGGGYVGLTTGAMLAEGGHRVRLADVDPIKVGLINDGISPIVEEGLDPIVHRTVKEEKTLRATLDVGEAVTGANVILLTLPTPSAADGRHDLSMFFNGVEQMAPHLNEEQIVVVKSTVPVGTTRRLGNMLAELTGKDIKVAHNPEFLAQGSAVKNTQNPDSIVIGTDFREEVKPVMHELWHPYLGTFQELIVVDPQTSEMAKLYKNGMLAADISFTNTTAEICERVGADFTRVSEIAGFDPRMSRFTSAGPGFGGSCFGKDIKSLAYIAREVGVDSRPLDLVTEINEYHQRRIAEKVKKALDNEPMEGKRVGLLGLAFKAGTDDMRDSAAIPFVNEMTSLGARIVAYDQAAMKVAQEKWLNGNELVSYAAHKYEAAEGVDALVIMTEWPEFKSLDLEHLRAIMRRPIIIDARHVLRMSAVRGQGFYYDAVGRPLIDERAAK